MPDSIVAHDLFLVAGDDHARFGAVSRTYEYRIYLKKNPFLQDTTWQVLNKNFDLNKLNDAAKILKNFTNFKAFSKSNTDVNTYDCIINKAEWIREGNLLTFHITANRFLRNMVRAIVGTLLDVGLDKTSVADFIKIIKSGDRTRAGASVKAQGLFLTKVNYPKNIFKNRHV